MEGEFVKSTATASRRMQSIGVTGRTLGQRKREHLYAAKDPGFHASALAYHIVKECDKGVKWDTAGIVGNPNRKRQLFMLEGIKIYENAHENLAINRTENTALVPKLWKDYFRWKHKTRDKSAIEVTPRIAQIT